MKCHFHPRANATAICSACGLSLCRQCETEDGGHTYCDKCYSDDDTGHPDAEAANAKEAQESEDLIDLELMDMLDTDDDDGLF